MADQANSNKGETMATDLTCGSGGSTGAEVITRINRLSELDPRATGRIATPAIVSINDADVVILPVIDEARTQRSGFEVDVDNNRLVNNTGFDFESVIVTIGINVSFPGSEELDLWVYLNDTPYASSEFSMQGRGNTKPQSVFWQSDVAMAHGDYIDVRGKNSATGTYDLTIERTQFRIDGDRKDVLL